MGAFAEYACIPEDGFVSHKPPTVSFEQAAAVPAAGATALKNLCERGAIRAGQTVLINGAAGGVGTFSVQIAKSFDTHVTAVCSTSNVEMVRSIGADEVVDYTRDDFTRLGRTYDLVLDNVGNRTLADLMRTLNPTGRCVVVGFTSMRRIIAQGMLSPVVSRKGGKSFLLSTNDEPNKEDILALAKLLESRTVEPRIDKVYPLERLAEAIGYVETLHARAKVVVVM